MIDLTPTARMRLNDYLDELRRVLSGSPSVDPADVERDVRDHIDTALAQYPAPVDEGLLNQVLGELGSPTQWLPGEERPWYRKSRAELLGMAKQRAVRTIQMATGGPESYRLAYLSLLVLVFGWSWLAASQDEDVVPFVILTSLVSFILSRAALSLFGTEQLSSGQKWLIYPSLVSVYLPLAAALFFGTAALSGALLLVNSERYQQDEDRLLAELREINVRLENHRLLPGDPPDLSQTTLLNSRDRLQTELKRMQSAYSFLGMPLTPLVAVCATVGVIGANWLLAGLWIVVMPGVVRNVFHPFAGRLTRWSGMGLTVIGLLMSLVGLTLLQWG